MKKHKASQKPAPFERRRSYVLGIMGGLAVIAMLSVKWCTPPAGSQTLFEHSDLPYEGQSKE